MAVAATPQTQRDNGRYRIGFRSQATDNLLKALVANNLGDLERAIGQGADVNRQLPEHRLTAAMSVTLTAEEWKNSKCLSLAGDFRLRTFHPVSFALQNRFLEGVRLLCRMGSDVSQCGNERKLFVGGRVGNITTEAASDDAPLLIRIDGGQETHAGAARTGRRPSSSRYRFESTGPKLSFSDVTSQTVHEVAEDVIGYGDVETMTAVFAADSGFVRNASAYWRAICSLDSARGIEAYARYVTSERVRAVNERLGDLLGYGHFCQLAEHHKINALRSLCSDPAMFPIPDQWFAGMLPLGSDAVRQILQECRRIHDSARTEITTVRTSATQPDPRYVPGLFSGEGDSPLNALHAPRNAAIRPAPRQNVPVSAVFEAFMADPGLPKDATIVELRRIFYELLDVEALATAEGLPPKFADKWLAFTRAFSRQLARFPEQPDIARFLARGLPAVSPPAASEAEAP